MTSSLPNETLQVIVLNLSFVFLLKVLSLVLAYLTIRLGYALLASGAKGEFKFSGGFGGARADLASASPGLLFVLLAIALAIYGISVTKVTTFEAGSVRASKAAPDVLLPPAPNGR